MSDERRRKERGTSSTGFSTRNRAVSGRINPLRRFTSLNSIEVLHPEYPTPQFSSPMSQPAKLTAQSARDLFPQGTLLFTCNYEERPILETLYLRVAILYTNGTIFATASRACVQLEAGLS